MLRGCERRQCKIRDWQKPEIGLTVLDPSNLLVAVRDALQTHNCRLVLAESCTAGNVAGSLAMVPGISSSLCGSFVVYRNESKAQWLGIDRQLLDDPHVGPVSAPVTRLLAQRALALTSEADLAAAVTGHVGPGCPAQLDGQVFFCLAKQGSSVLFESSLQLKSAAPRDSDDLAGRAARLREATQWVLQQIIVGAKVFVV